MNLSRVVTRALGLVLLARLKKKPRPVECQGFFSFEMASEQFPPWGVEINFFDTNEHPADSACSVYAG